MDKLFPNAVAYYHVRVTGEFALKQVSSALGLYENHACSIVSMEDPTNHRHFHCLLGLSTHKYTGHLREYIKKTLNISGVEFSVSKCKNLQKLKKYVIKEGHYINNGFNTDELEKLQLVAFKKNRKEMLEALDVLDIDFLTTGDAQRHWLGYVQLKNEFGQCINEKWWINHIITLKLRDENYAKKYFNEKLKYCL